MIRRSIWAMAALFCVPVIGGLVYSALRTPDRTSSGLEVSKDLAGSEGSSLRASIVFPPPPSPQAAPALDVDTFSPAAVYPLAAWSLGAAGGGWLDYLSIGGRTAALGSNVAVKDGDIIQVGGWAGDASLGMRLPYILLSVCDVVVATVATSIPRPDVAQSIHPNLGMSGWQAKLLADDLPRCEDMTLQAYGVAAARRIAFPLLGSFDLKASDPGSSATLLVNHAPPAILPDILPEAVPLMVVTITGNRVNLRRCGDAKCDVVGNLTAGKHEVTILDETSEWLLLASPKANGWLARRVTTSVMPKITKR